MPVRNLDVFGVHKHATHCVNQIGMRKVKNGDLVAVFNEERYDYHHDSGQTRLTRSSDGGKTWSEPQVALPWTDTTGNWDCGFCELEDGSWLINVAITGYFKRGIQSSQPSWSAHPMSEEWGDWTWAYRTQGWLGTVVIRSTDQGKTWSDPIPVNVRPMMHGGCRLGCWQLPNGSLLMGLYGKLGSYNDDVSGETIRSALMRSDDGGQNWEYYSTLAFDPAGIIDYTEPALLRLDDGRLVCFLRNHTRPAGEAKNLVMIVSEDDGFSWTPPKWTNIWGYPPELLRLNEGRYLMVYGYRRPPWGVRGVISEDGVTWDVANEFVIREGGLPGDTGVERPGSSRMTPASGRHGTGKVDTQNPGIYQHIGYPTVAQLDDGTVAVAFHEWTDDERPLQHILCARFEVE